MQSCEREFSTESTIYILYATQSVMHYDPYLSNLMEDDSNPSRLEADKFKGLWSSTSISVKLKCIDVVVNSSQTTPPIREFNTGDVHLISPAVSSTLT